MTPEQVENWIQFSDCVINNAKYFAHTRLLADKTLDFHAWMFGQIITVTNIQATVILTNFDPAVDAAQEIEILRDERILDAIESFDSDLDKEKNEDSEDDIFNKIILQFSSF
ncbi:9316_t:CDS:2, partial [Gigaspora margarita]